MKRSIPVSVLLILVIFGIGLASCRGPLESMSSAAAPKAAAGNTIVWYGDSDKAVAVSVSAKSSAQTNASGAKITSNAHSADFPGIYFIWDSKQKDSGYLKVRSSVFDVYESFTLTSKESNNYWDFVIQPLSVQQKTADGCYVFYIPKADNNKNINMVFIGNAKKIKSDWPPISFFPDAQSFTKEIVNLPNPFVSWDGYKVTQSNWDSRRTEISQIIQHYLLGYKHPDEGFTSEIVTITGTTTRVLTIRVTREETGVSGTFLASVYVPAGTAPEGGWPVIMTLGMSGGTPGTPSNSAAAANRGYATMSLPTYNICGEDSSSVPFINARINSGLVPQLFPETVYWSAASRGVLDEEFQRYDTRNGWIDDYGDPDAPGLMMNWIWGISRLIDALEAYNEKPAEEKLFSVDPAKIAVTGASRMGKLSLFAAAFDERIAVSAPAETCGGGLNIERFVSVSVNEADSHKNFPINWRGPSDPILMTQGFDNANWPPYNLDKTEGFGPFDGYGPLNKSYQYLKFEEVMSGTGTSTLIRARQVSAGEALIDPTRDLNGGVTKNFPTQGNGSVMGHVLWKGVPELTSQTTLATHVDNMATNIKDGYGVHRTSYQYNQPAGSQDRFWATQTLLNIRWLYPSYWNSRFHQFPLIFPDLNIHARHLQGDWGYAANLPFDMHYLSALVAPRGLIMFGGHTSPNSGMESAFMNYLAVKEVYRLLDVEDNVGIAVYVHAHTQPAQTYLDLMDFCDAYYAGTSMPSRLVPKTVETYPYPINDPRSRYDYMKLDWAAPGYEPIANQVKRLVPDNFSYGN